MVFEPGHPHYPTKDGGAPNQGKPIRERIRARSLALVIRENWPPEEIFRWLREVTAGRDPDAEPSPDGHVSQLPIDWQIRMRAAKMLLERALGQPAQHVVLEAELRAQVGVVAAAATPQAWSRLPSGELNQLRATMRSLLVGGAAAHRRERDVAPEVIDAESREPVDPSK
jgi:hypothetical protein